jgi:uncharacterized protein YkwD
MKALIKTLIAITLILTMTTPVFANQVKVVAAGQYVEFGEQPPVIIDGRTLIPVRGLFEQIGFNVDWNPQTQQVTLTNSEYTVVLTVNNQTFTTNGRGYTLDVPAQIINGRTMLPVRAILESVGYDVIWIPDVRYLVTRKAANTAPAVQSTAPVAQIAQPTEAPRQLPAASLQSEVHIDINDRYLQEIKDEFLKLINQHRATRRATALRANLEVQDYADIRAVEIKELMGHTRPDGSWFGSGWTGTTAILSGENCAKGNAPGQDPKEVALRIFNQWKNSPGHNNNMLSRISELSEMGLGLDIQCLKNGNVSYNAVLILAFAAPNM